MLLPPSNVAAGSRFSSKYPCSDAKKICVSKGLRTVDGFEVYKDCWDWAYVKTCNYPSKNDCRLYEHCYAVGDKGCLLQDSLGNCVNMQKEFSCKSWEIVNKEHQTTRMGFEEKPGKDGLICKGVPCIDGHCVDKSYETNGEMMDSLSKLYAVSNMNPDKDGNFNLFEGSNQHCAKKAVGYSNCCRINHKGWGKQLGANCTKDEQILMDMRSKRLCVYVGSQKKKKAGVPVLTKHRYCCFGNMLDKVIQVQGRKQLGRSFGTGSNPNCSGLSLEDIQAIDWDKVDFTEFIEDLKVKFAGSLKLPSVSDLSSTIENSLPNIRKYDDNPLNPDNNLTGWNTNIKDDSWEAQEERRIVEERKAKERAEQERLAKIEAERLEQERLAKLEAERLEQEKLAKLEEERLRKLNRERYTARIHASRKKMKEIQDEMKSSQKKKSKAWHELGLATSEWEKTGRWYLVSSPHRETYLDKMRKPQEEIRRLDTRILQLRAEYNSQKQIAYSRYCPKKKY